MKSSSPAVVDALKARVEGLKTLTGSSTWEFGAYLEPALGSARKVLSFGELFVPLDDLIDVAAERERLEKELKEAERDLSQAEAKLADKQFLSRAPGDVVEKERGKRDEFAQKVERLEANLASLGA